MPGETDLARMLATLDVVQRPGRFAFVTGEWPSLAAAAAATIHEDEGPTYVVTTEQADAAGAPVDFEAAWLTLTIHSALEAVGLTAAFSAALGEASIPCNVLAGYHHDHLLVPADRADEAVSVLRSLAG
ncbi:MAG: ACT domain-containing protein [Ilumatobacter fluminis]|uniref:ACT domain-containing protein n=1 Tax=Ilumatobacter fluminis TaxID=467091 RepID=UPI0032EE9B07